MKTPFQCNLKLNAINQNLARTFIYYWVTESQNAEIFLHHNNMFYNSLPNIIYTQQTDLRFGSANTPDRVHTQYAVIGHD